MMSLDDSNPWAMDSEIKHIVVNEGIKNIGSRAFWGLDYLESITLPEGLIEIGAYAFSTSRTSLDNTLYSVSLPSTLKIIGHCAFYSNHRLESITIPAGILNLSSDAFDSCRNLTSITYGGTEAQWAAFSVDVPASCKVSCSDNNFTALQALIDGTADGGTLTLDKDYIALSTEERISIPSGKTITIDLNGHTINRNLTAAISGGNVIKNSGNLTITDTSDANTGKITGGWTTSSGGGIYSNGTLTLESGTISGNKAEWYAGGVCSGKFTMNGGTISGNTAGLRGGGVDFVALYGPRIGRGSAINITENTVSGNACNVRLFSGMTITVNSVPVSGSQIGISTDDTPTASAPVTITDDCKGDISYFFSDYPGYVIAKSGSAAILAVPTDTKAVTFDSNGGSGTMPDMHIVPNTASALDPNTFTRTDFNFTGWNTEANGTGASYADKAEVTLTNNLTLYAQWSSIITYTYVARVAPGCTSSGTAAHYKGSDGKYYTYDGSTYTQVSYSSLIISALGHNTSFVSGTPATCTSSGTASHYKCSRCGKLFTDAAGNSPATLAALTTTALGHDYISEVTTPATCIEAGLRTYTCSRCGDTYTEEIPAAGHSYETVRENEVEPTCRDAGSYDEVVKCSVCGDEKSRTAVTVPALGHTFENGVCIRCGAIEVKAGGLFAALENAVGEKVMLALDGDETVMKLKFPKNVKEITIDGCGHTLTFAGAAAIKPNQKLTLYDIAIKAEKNGKKQNITVTAAAGGLVLEKVALDGKKATITASKGDLTLDDVSCSSTLALKGSTKTALTVSGAVGAYTVTGFNAVNAAGTLTVTKTLKVNTLDLSDDAVLNVVKGAAITLSKGISGNGAIYLASGFKAITINGKATGNIKLTGTKMTDGQLIFKSKLTNLNDVFDVSEISPEVTDGEYSYGLYSKSGKVYLRAFKMRVGDTTYCEFTDIMTDITKVGKSGESYSLDLLGNVDLGKAFKLPTKNKYASLTVDGGGHTLTFSGSSITLTGNLKLTNLTLNATAKNGCTIKQNGFTLDAGGAELINCKIK